MDFNGHVLYGIFENHQLPFGIVSNDHQRKATCTFIPNNLKKLLIEIEDKRFYYHHGLDCHKNRKNLNGTVCPESSNINLLEGGSICPDSLAKPFPIASILICENPNNHP
ncbi:MAG: hypothetical protein WKF68_10995 [Daejeonella sp.]